MDEKLPIQNGNKKIIKATDQSTSVANKNPNPTLLPPGAYGQVNIENMKGKRQGGY